MAKYNIDETDREILDILVENSRASFADIAKKLNISAGTVNIRLKKMEELGFIKDSTILVDYQKLDYCQSAYVGITLERQHQTHFVIERLVKIPNIISASVTSGKFNIFCKIRTKDTKQTKDIIFKIGDIQGVVATESFICFDEPIDDQKRIMHKIFRDLSQ